MDTDIFFFKRIPEVYCYEIEIGEPGGDAIIGVRLRLEKGEFISIYHVELEEADDALINLTGFIEANKINSKKLLATLATVVLDFLDVCPWAFILAEESRFVQAKLLRMCIVFMLEKVPGYFVVAGRRHEQWDAFIKGVSYDAFTIRRKFAL